MFVILSYDVTEHHQKIIKICREYLIHELESVFDGEISKAKLKELCEHLKPLLKNPDDHLIIYEFDQMKYSRIISLGSQKEEGNLIV